MDIAAGRGMKMVLQQVFPNGHTPFHLNRGECLDPSAIRLAIDVCTKNNKFAVDVIKCSGARCVVAGMLVAHPG